MLDCFAKTVRNDGILALYGGFSSNFARLGAWNSAMFVTAEYVKGLMRGKDD